MLYILFYLHYVPLLWSRLSISDAKKSIVDDPVIAAYLFRLSHVHVQARLRRQWPMQEMNISACLARPMLMSMMMLERRSNIQSFKCNYKEINRQKG